MTDVLFGVLVMAVAALFALGVSHLRPAMPGWVVPLVVIGWIAIPGALARAQLLDRYDPLPAPGLMVVLAVTVGTIALATGKLGERFASSFPLATLVGFQAFRVPVELILHRWYVEGVVPEQMTYTGYNFDIVTGATAIVMALAIRGGRASRALVAVWNVMGLLLLANIVTIAVLSTPVSFRMFENEPANLVPSTFPHVWLPTLLVQAALFGHLVVFRALKRARAD